MGGAQSGAEHLLQQLEFTFSSDSCFDETKHKVVQRNPTRVASLHTGPCEGPQNIKTRLQLSQDLSFAPLLLLPVQGPGIRLTMQGYIKLQLLAEEI